MTIDEIKRQIFIDSEEVCGNTMIDTYSAQEYVEQAYNKAIDDFVEAIDRADREEPLILDMYEIEQIAEQLKEGASNGTDNQ